MGQIRFERTNNAFRDFKITYDLTERQKGTFAVRKHLLVLSQHVLMRFPHCLSMQGVQGGESKLKGIEECNGLLRDRW